MTGYVCRVCGGKAVYIDNVPYFFHGKLYHKFLFRCVLCNHSFTRLPYQVLVDFGKLSY